MSWADLGVPEPSGNETPAPKPAKQPTPPKEPKPPRTPKQPGSGGGSRTPLILGIIAGILLIAVIVTLAIALTRPSGDAQPAPAPPTSEPGTASPAPTPTATATDEVGPPTAMTFSGTGFVLTDEDGDEVFTYAWRDDAQDAVDALTEAFGAAPTQRVEPGDGTHYPDYTVYQWDGFLLFDMIESTGGATRDTYPQPSYVLFSRNEVGGIAMEAEHGLEIGMPIAAVRAAGPDQEIPRGNVGAIRFVFDQERSAGDDPLQYSTFADTDGSVVTAVLYYRYSSL
ncbi:hypothetical protein [Microbacterium sp. bgisy203]|uniref:hypothetical protein n=1 Tax=Microbacterium sp. bgisy203 TaxID=3413799 RepID=UPI003D727CB7